MAAICAACQVAVRPQEKFVIAHTEVLHPECARRGRVTVLATARRELATRSVELASAERRLAMALHDLEGTQRRAAALEQQCAVLQRARDSAVADAEDVRRRLQALAQAPPAAAATSTDPDPPVEDAAAIRYSLLEL